MALSCVVSEILNFKKCCDLENQVRGHWKWYHSTDLVWFPISILY